MHGSLLQIDSEVVEYEGLDPQPCVPGRKLVSTQLVDPDKLGTILILHAHATVTGGKATLDVQPCDPFAL